MSRKTVIIGGGGFVGQRLARALLERGDDLCLAGLGNRPSAPAILTEQEWNRVRWLTCDVRSDVQVDAFVKASRPDFIVHLAAISFVPAADRHPLVAYDTNALGGLRVALSASRARSDGACDPTVLVVGSGTQYGRPLHAAPIPETAEQRPLTVYAATKTSQETAVLQVARASGLRVICTRSFNHAGAGQETSFLLPSLASRLRQAEASGVLWIGNDVVRDYLHVDDVVEAYLALAERGESGEVYNVCSGRGVGVRELAGMLLRRAGIEARVEVDEDLQRPSEIPVLIGSPEKLQRTTGWEPQRSHEQMVDDVLKGPRTQ